MKLNGWIVLLAGMTLAPALPGAETVFLGFGKSWAF